MNCPHCGSTISIGATFCPQCTRRVLGYADCPACHEPIAKESKYCPYCGQRVRKYQIASRYELPPLDLAVRSTHLGMLVRMLSLSGFIRLCHSAAQQLAEPGRAPGSRPDRGPSPSVSSGSSVPQRFRSHPRQPGPPGSSLTHPPFSVLRVVCASVIQIPAKGHRFCFE